MKFKTEGEKKSLFFVDGKKVFAFIVMENSLSFDTIKFNFAKSFDG